ncbi:hypothetical protein SERLA73DRAFT_177366 [Serpula lacrymans var. lacrymans S7.3]|uniref:Vacuole protein n=2 Tax=Serpula lacrymans var. lacrymans TaxID=341189 RepID=F8PNV3_SERL3|nr:uncharacterized protein SERLADRAFT_460923 [Serpula lacrymans var. lacrymans S7.9]EGO01830.1 hypothetical protein SERLA73DRAFT_177366 [Serpula lacrymans var. lacrymans S7.3]EGO27459.1 hypothetical protein SERLADRAFT_460923 [Serpula lacrymans var. lacrymans S7.9]
MSGPAWKREIVPDHKFDFIDTRDFTDNGFGMRMKYLWLYIIILKSFLVYISDIFSATTMLTTSSWSNQIFDECQTLNGCFYIPFNIGKWLFVGCIIFGFLLLAYEARKSKKIIASRDISYAFTNVMANNYYSLRSYDHFCFFDHISNSTKKKDDFAFFIFFTFKSWKRLLLSDGPRQTINALTLYSIYLAKRDDGSWYDVSKYFAGNTLSTSALTVTTFFTFVIFAGSLLLLIVAGIFYIPLLCYIQGNLKEYVCHKVDKRIAEVIKRRNKERLVKAAALAKKEAMGDYSHLKNKKGELIAQPLPQPTLPNLSVDDDADDASSLRREPSNAMNKEYYYSSDNKSLAPSYHTHAGNTDYSLDYPPMPAYNQGYSSHQAPGAYAQYNSSMPTFDEDPQLYDDDYSSTMHLPTAAAPIASQRTDIPLQNPYGNSDYYGDAHDVYQGRGVPGGDYRQPAPYTTGIRPPSDGERRDYADAHDYSHQNYSGYPAAAYGEGHAYQGQAEHNMAGAGYGHDANYGHDVNYGHDASYGHAV